MTYKILIVDDQTDNLEVIVRFIEESKAPYELMQALNAEVAYDIACNELPNLIITDWEMPNTDGIQLVKMLKANKTTSDIPIIMCTGVMTSSENLQMALEAGAVDYIRKPIDKIELLARINSSLKLAESFSEIKKLNNSKDTIFSIITHDLRTPVGNIRNFSKWILDKQLLYDEDKLKNLLNTIHSQSSSTFQTLETLLAWAKCQNQSFLYEPIKSSMNEIIDDVLELLKFSAEAKNLKFKLKIEENIGGHFDPAMISTVLRNLITNAIKFSHEGEQVTIEAKNEKNTIVVSIKDKGLGISQKRLQNIFDSTNYESTFGTQGEQGSGLGLKICKEFIEKHQGELTVKSYTNKGSNFTFTIPQL